MIRRYGKLQVRTTGFTRTQILRRGVAITAMMELPQRSHGDLCEHPAQFNRYRAEMLAWLLGDDPNCFDICHAAARSPDEYPNPTEVGALLGTARQRPDGDKLPSALTGMIKQRLMTLRVQREACEEPYTPKAWKQNDTAAFRRSRAMKRWMAEETVKIDGGEIVNLNTMSKRRTGRWMNSCWWTTPD